MAARTWSRLVQHVPRLVFMRTRIFVHTPSIARYATAIGAASFAGYLFSSRAFAQSVDFAPLAQKAQEMYGQHPDAIYLLLRPAAQAAIDDSVTDAAAAQVLWRFARTCHDMATDIEVYKQGSKTGMTHTKSDLITEGYEAAQRAVALDPSSSACHKWMAIMISDIGDLEGLKNKLLKSYTMKEHFEKAIELDPSDATSQHLLGVWCFSFADLPWYQRQAASAVFATPPSSSYDEALFHFQAAEATDPGFYTKNAYYLGMTHARMGNKAEAKQYVLGLSRYDREAHELAAKLLKSL